MLAKLKLFNCLHLAFISLRCSFIPEAYQMIEYKVAYEWRDEEFTETVVSRSFITKTVFLILRQANNWHNSVAFPKLT